MPVGKAIVEEMGGGGSGNRALSVCRSTLSSMSEFELPPVAFTLSEVQALSGALTAAVSGGAGADEGLLAALRKLAATVVCADERTPAPRQLDLFPDGSTAGPTTVDTEPEVVAPVVGRPRLSVVTEIPLAAEEPAAAATGASAESNVVALRSRTTATTRVAVDEDVRETVEQAVRDRRVLRIEYTDGRGTTSIREVEPAGLLAASGKWTLIGWCRSRQEGRGFRLDRVSTAEVTGIPAPDRDLASVLGPLGRPAQAR